MRRIKFILAVSTALTTPVFAQEQAETILEPIIIEATAGKGITETTAGDVQGYRALTAASATKTATPIERIPQNIEVIPRKLLDDQSANSVSEALKNVSSVQPQDSRSIGNVEIGRAHV